MDIKEAIEYALDGRAVLFTGAGFSYGAENINSLQIPAGKALAQKLLTDIGYKNPQGGLDKVTAAYLRRKPDQELVDLLTNAFSVGKVTPSHVTLASLPWRRVYTTNYDMVLEEASRQAKVVRSSVDGIDSPRDHLAKPNLVVHLNGAITRLTTDRLHSSFKLISESYSTEAFQNSEWAFHFRADIRNAAVVIFVGYSMYDLDIRRILYGEDISDKTLFVTAPLNDENELEAEDLADLGYLAPIGIDAFAKTVDEIKSSYIPRKPSLLLDAWEKISSVPAISSPPRDADVLDFLSMGDARPALLLEACSPNAPNYVIPIEVSDEIESALLKLDRDVLVIGGVGTGKTFVCECVAQRMAVRGWHVYRIAIPNNDEISEIQQACEIPGPKLLVVENYPRHMELLRWIAETNPTDTIVLATARSHVHELFAADFFRLMTDNCLLFDISQLSDNQIVSAASLLDRYGIWGDKASWPMQRKIQFLTKDCKAELPFILLDILKSQHVAGRFRTLVEESNNRRDVEEVLICTFTLEVMQFSPRVTHVQELLADRIQWAKVRSQNQLKPIVDFKAHHIHVKSVVLASYMLQHVFSAKAIVLTLIGMAKEAEARISNVAYRQIFTSMMRYSQVSLALPESNRLDSAIAFYEGIKNLPSARIDPQFWLQYAISCMAFGKIKRAERYFADAYEYAKKRQSYNTYQIDNHYARLLLEKALLTPTVNDAIEMVDKARKLLFPQLATEVRYHPYRVAIGFSKCYERLRSELSPEQTKYFKKILEEIKRRAEIVSKTLKNRYVEECLEKTGEALSSMEV